uniref:Uncharacterized protein n=1 Tax=Anguilla anguilla TaxID=7936 RepID=A0A0E9X966_ANGAN
MTVVRVLDYFVYTSATNVTIEGNLLVRYTSVPTVHGAFASPLLFCDVLTLTKISPQGKMTMMCRYLLLPHTVRMLP